MDVDSFNRITLFNVVQSVTDLTHEKGHTLELVFSCRLSVHDICEMASISDHMFVFFAV